MRRNLHIPPLIIFVNNSYTRVVEVRVIVRVRVVKGEAPHSCWEVIVLVSEDNRTLTKIIKTTNNEVVREKGKESVKVTKEKNANKRAERGE